MYLFRRGAEKNFKINYLLKEIFFSNLQPGFCQLRIGQFFVELLACSHVHCLCLSRRGGERNQDEAGDQHVDGDSAGWPG